MEFEWQERVTMLEHQPQASSLQGVARSGADEETDRDQNSACNSKTADQTSRHVSSVLILSKRYKLASIEVDGSFQHLFLQCGKKDELYLSWPFGCNIISVRLPTARRWFTPPFRRRPNQGGYGGGGGASVGTIQDTATGVKVRGKKKDSHLNATRPGNFFSAGRWSG